jgi:glutamate N-acetyltransferase/amino-acid N-acetyltransferase
MASDKGFKVRKVIEGSVTAPRGFRAGGVFCDIKRLGTGKGSNKGQKRDLAILISDVPAAVAGMFTTSRVCAAPVKVSLKRAAQPSARAIVVNSGNANACTGKQGLEDAEEMTRLTAKQLGLMTEEVLICSTGRIGVTMPMDNVARGVEGAAKILKASKEAGDHFSEAIMTSDTRPKQIAVEFMLGGTTVRLGGACKGAGMIQPGMSATGTGPAAGLHATMLGFVTTDAAIEHKTLKDCLEKAVARSFNRISVDGDMSTNDTVIALANGLAGNSVLKKRSEELPRFQQALDFVTLELAKMIVKDGEGVTRFVTLHVGADSERDAELAARAVANSALVKTSWFGGDPNWGRIMGALGYSGAKFKEELVSIAYGIPGTNKRLNAVECGMPTDVPFSELCKCVAEKEIEIFIDLSAGKYVTTLYTTDLTEEYVDFNKGDVTDPSSLGG